MLRIGHNYICNSRACMNALHDTESQACFGCRTSDVRNITTGRSNRQQQNSPVLENKYPYSDIVHSPITIEDEDDDVYGSSNMEEDVNDEAAVNENYNNLHLCSAFKSIGTSSFDLVKMVDVAVQTNHSMCYKVREIHAYLNEYIYEMCSRKRIYLFFMYTLCYFCFQPLKVHLSQPSHEGSEKENIPSHANRAGILLPLADKHAAVALRH